MTGRAAPRSEGGAAPDVTGGGGSGNDMQVKEMWVVSNPTGQSTMSDICSKMSLQDFVNYVIGGYRLESSLHGIRVYAGPDAEKEARIDAKGRLRAQSLLVDHLREMDRRHPTDQR